MRKVWKASLMLSLLFSVKATAQVSTPTGPIPGTFFGLNSRISNGHWPPTDGNGQALPIKTVRLWDTGTQWGEIEASSGSYNWNGMDKQTSTAASEGLDVEYTFGGTPSWAGGCSTCSPTDVNADGSGTDAMWSAFVTAMVTRYKGKIQFYELWNEQNASNYWTGTEAQMARMAKDAYAIIKSIDPAAKVLTPSQTGGTGEAQTLTAYLQAGGGAYADIIAFHGRAAGSLDATPENVATIVNALQPVISDPSLGLAGKPLWNTEGGWRPGEVPNVDDQAAFVARQYLILASMGVQRYYWYGWDNGNGWGTLYTGGPTIAATAYTQVADWLTGASFTSPCAQNASSGNWSCGFTEANGTPAIAIWNPNGGSGASYSPASIYTRYRDLTGKVVTVSGPVTLGTKPILLEAPGASGPPAKPNAPTGLQVIVH